MFFFNSDSIRESGQKVPAYIRFPLAILVVGALVYYIYDESGPYAWVTNFQMSLMDYDYYPVISMAFTIIVVLTPALFIGWLLSKLFTKKEDSAEENE